MLILQRFWVNGCWHWQLIRAQSSATDTIIVDGEK